LGDAKTSQRSQRYVEERNFAYYTPPELKDNSAFEYIMDECNDIYNAMIANGVKKEIARYVLPNATMTEIIMTMNLRELRHFIKLRTNKAALPEMREVATQIKEMCMGFAPKVFKDL
jgi:thymidylate synthase (FAD)